MSLLPGFSSVTLRDKVHEYDDVYSFRFDRHEIAYEAGQYAHMLVGSVGRSNVREFSFASAPSETELVFTMHVGSDTDFKRQIMALKAGDTVQLFKIKGDFTLPTSDAKPVVFIAGGVGMTPIRSLLKEADSQGRQFERSLVQVQRGDFLYDDEVSTGLKETFKVAPEQLAATISEVIQTQPGADYYVCGSERFLDGVLAMLKQAGVGEDRIRTENFKQYPVEDKPLTF